MNAAIADMFPEAAAPVELLNGDQRFTMRETLAWCMERAGVEAYAVDVAACEESHHSPVWYSKADDGLTRPWFGHVWCNPPFSDIEPWVERAWQVMAAGEATSVSMLLPASRTEQPWWQQHVEAFRDRGPVNGVRLTTHFLPGRTRFGHPGNPQGIGVGSPPFGCVLLVWRWAP